MIGQEEQYERVRMNLYKEFAGIESTLKPFPRKKIYRVSAPNYAYTEFVEPAIRSAITSINRIFQSEGLLDKLADRLRPYDPSIYCVHDYWSYWTMHDDDDSREYRAKKRYFRNAVVDRILYHLFSAYPKSSRGLERLSFNDLESLIKGSEEISPDLVKLDQDIILLGWELGKDERREAVLCRLGSQVQLAERIIPNKILLNMDGFEEPMTCCIYQSNSDVYHCEGETTISFKFLDYLIRENYRGKAALSLMRKKILMWLDPERGRLEPEPRRNPAHAR
jgi:hypothetical protein